WDVLEGTLPGSELTGKAVAATRQLAKRQMTWMRAMPELELLDPMAGSSEAALMRRFETFFKS
ncbi:MAG: tRNA (adenosine(37)-N6)-dimethylallyltransferase MiaA, partial [Betaproteobacteria bacterium]|nr:tRNA (adenosine(37)-N6)-dimethylallyltransferase MiaA [Betaproteobacteria bacterium]